MSSPAKSYTYVVEHLDPELESWSSLEYASIARESHAANSKFYLSSVSPNLKLPENLQNVQGLNVEQKSVEEIFRDKKDKVCLLDPSAERELSPEDGDVFEVFLFGGILGDDPPRDRTSELRAKGYQGRRLGPVQMTTDTAVRVTRLIIQEKILLEKIPYIDHPELKVDAHESTVMPFRYVKDEQGGPVMPEGMVELIKSDSERGIEDLF